MPAGAPRLPAASVSICFYLKDTCAAFWFIVRVRLSVVCLGGDDAFCHSSSGQEKVPPNMCRSPRAAPHPAWAAARRRAGAAPHRLPQGRAIAPAGGASVLCCFYPFSAETLFSGFLLRRGALGWSRAGWPWNQQAVEAGGAPTVLCPELRPHSPSQLSRAES